MIDKAKLDGCTYKRFHDSNKTRLLDRVRDLIIFDAGHTRVTRYR